MLVDPAVDAFASEFRRMSRRHDPMPAELVQKARTQAYKGSPGTQLLSGCVELHRPGVYLNVSPSLRSTARVSLLGSLHLPSGTTGSTTVEASMSAWTKVGSIAVLCTRLDDD